MRLTDKRLLEARNLEDFLFRLKYRDGDNVRRMALREIAGLLNTGFTSPDLTRIWGVDISPWDGNVNFAPLVHAGGKFVFIKAMDGTIPSRYYRENVARAIQAGLLHGPYQWLYPDRFVSCKGQAKAYYELIKDIPVSLPPVIDFEWTRYNGQTANPNYEDLDKWVTEFNRLSGVEPFLYSAAGFMNPLGKIPADLLRKFSGLWGASYGTQPVYPMGINHFDVWQFSSFGDALKLCPGDKNKQELDLNYMSEEFYGRFAVVEPPEEETMANYEVRSDFYSMTLRPDHNTGALGTESVPAGTVMQADQIWTATQDLWVVINGVNTKVNAVGDKWAHVVRVAGQTKNSWVAIVHKGITYCNYVREVAEVPTITLKHTIEVYSDGSIRVDGNPYP